jgi:hypothetical protein
VIPLPVILVEFVVALGLALFLANTVAYVRLRREDNWPPSRPPCTPVPTRRREQAAAARAQVPSRTRILSGITIGFVMAVWGVATFVTEGYSF